MYILIHECFIFFLLAYPLQRQKRSLEFDIYGDRFDESGKLVTWSGDKDPNDFKNWSVDEEGNFFMDIPLTPQVVSSNEEVVWIDNPNHSAEEVFLMYFVIYVIYK